MQERLNSWVVFFYLEQLIERSKLHFCVSGSFALRNSFVQHFKQTVLEH